MRLALSTRAVAALGALALLSGGAIALARQRGVEGDLDIAELRTASPSRVPVLRVRSRNGSSNRPIAFLVHGSQCNKAMMAPLAKDLALNGFDAYAIDLPGHGASEQVFSEERAYQVAREALRSIVAERHLDASRVALIGHSYGAKVVGRLAAEDDGRWAATVLVGPVYGGGFSPERPRDLLVLTAERDPPFIQASASAIARDVSRRIADGDASRDGARRWREIGGADHLSLLVDVDVRREVVSWTERAIPGAGAPGVRLVSVAPAGAVALLAVAAVLAISALAGLASRRVLAPPRAPGPVRSRLRPIAVALAACALAPLAVRATVPLRFLGIAEGEVLASALFLAGVAMTALAVLLCREWLPSPSQLARGLPVALVAAALVYAAAASTASRDLYHLTFDGAPVPRLVAAVVLASCAFPFFAFTEAILDDIRRAGGSGPLAHLRAVGLAALFYAVLAGALALASPPLARFAAPAAVALTCGAAFAGVLSTATANFAAGAAFSAIATAWIVAVGFMRI